MKSGSGLESFVLKGFCDGKSVSDFLPSFEKIIFSAVALEVDRKFLFLLPDTLYHPQAISISRFLLHLESRRINLIAAHLKFTVFKNCCYGIEPRSCIPPEVYVIPLQVDKAIHLRWVNLRQYQFWRNINLNFKTSVSFKDCLFEVVTAIWSMF